MKTLLCLISFMKAAEVSANNTSVALTVISCYSIVLTVAIVALALIAWKLIDQISIRLQEKRHRAWEIEDLDRKHKANIEDLNCKHKANIEDLNCKHKEELQKYRLAKLKEACYEEKNGKNVLKTDGKEIVKYVEELEKLIQSK